jgi:hypothetical protein
MFNKIRYSSFSVFKNLHIPFLRDILVDGNSGRTFVCLSSVLIERAFQSHVADVELDCGL